MAFTPLKYDLYDFPADFHPLLHDAEIYDSSYSLGAKVIFIDKDGGYYLKSAPKGALEQESVMTRYFNAKGLAANVVDYISEKKDWLLTEKIYGDNCLVLADKYTDQPERLCDILAERLVMLHDLDSSDCPVQNNTERFLERAEQNMRHGLFNKEIAEKNKLKNPTEAWNIVKRNGHLLKSKTLLHGDYSLPNILLNDWQFSGFIDLDTAGVGDRHIDLFWGSRTMDYNLVTNKYRQRFIDAYGRDKVDEEILQIVAAMAVFG